MEDILKTLEPDQKDWDSLYRTALEFKLAAPWDWISSEEVVAIENQLNSEIGFCSILGSGRQEYGVGIYMGDEGYQGFLKVVSGKIEPENFFSNASFPMFSMLLVDRETMQKKDLEIIHRTRVQFRGKKAWPLFRSVLPGYFPWFLNKDEVLYFIDVLQQILIISDRIKGNDLVLNSREIGNKVLTRRLHEGKWIDEWRQSPKPVVATKENVIIGAVKEAQLLLLKNSAGPLEGEWELDMFSLPSPVKSDNGRPFYPICILVIDKKQGLIVNTRLIEPNLSAENKQDELINILKESLPMPATIWVNSKPVKALLKPLAENLGINLRSGPLPMVTDARRHLMERFG